MQVRVGVSSCLLGAKCNFNGNDLLSDFVKNLEAHEQIEMISFCPEDFAFGSPRPNLRIVNGDGFDVLDGKAFVIDENGKDITREQITGAEKFLHRLVSSQVKYAILMDGSPSCGSNVLLKEEGWPRGGFKRGVGVAAALLRRNDIKVFSSFDEKSISSFMSSILEDFKPASLDLRDLKDSEKFKPLFQ